jgi:hypothetical protein
MEGTLTNNKNNKEQNRRKPFKNITRPVQI